MALVVHIRHSRLRGNIRLPGQPGTIAAVVSQCARMEPVQCFDPAEDSATTHKKLSHFRYGMDREAGTIVVDGCECPDGQGCLLKPEEHFLDVLNQWGKERGSRSATLTLASTSDEGPRT